MGPCGTIADMSDEAASIEVTSSSRGNARIDLSIRLSRFNLPPVQSALAVGRHASIGSRAITKALEEMSPGTFALHELDHPIVEGILVRTAHVRRVPTEKLLRVLLRHAEQFMTDTDMLHFDIAIEVLVQDRIDL